MSVTSHHIWFRELAFMFSAMFSSTRAPISYWKMFKPATTLSSNSHEAAYWRGNTRSLMQKKITKAEMIIFDNSRSSSLAHLLACYLKMTDFAQCMDVAACFAPVFPDNFWSDISEYIYVYWQTCPCLNIPYPFPLQSVGFLINVRKNSKRRSCCQRFFFSSILEVDLEEGSGKVGASVRQ